MSRKASKMEKQSGVIPYRIRNGRIEVLLISNRTSKKWVIPKGGIPKAMTPADSAVKEAWEEAGVVGHVNDNQLGSYKYRKQGKIYNVEVFLLPVEVELSDWLEASTRVRQWLDVPSAAKQVKPAALKRLLKISFDQITLVICAD
jgi:8-oxo-dGTP pyrophosphatase MutT (NUDIX family)